MVRTSWSPSPTWVDSVWPPSRIGTTREHGREKSLTYWRGAARRHRTSTVRCAASSPSEGDPLEVLRWVGRADNQQLVMALEDALCAAEARAVATAEPTPYGREVIVGARQGGLPVAVSNNS